MHSPMKHIPGLNGLRGISIVLVVNSHLILNDHIEVFKVEYGWLKAILRTFYDGQLGVNIFFVLSGFLITRILAHTADNPGEISLQRFYARRVLRIFPAYYTMLLVYFILQYIGVIHLERESWITSITYTKYFNYHLDFLTSHAWTLSIEEHFYLVWPMIFVLGKRVQRYFTIFLVLIVPFIRVYGHYHEVSFLSNYTIFYRIDAIAVGCVIALYEKEITRNIQPYWRYVFPIVLAALLCFRVGANFVRSIGLGDLFIPLGTTSGTVANVLIALLILYTVHGPKSYWSSFVNHPWITQIGVYSYSIYLWQQLFLTNTPIFWANRFPQNLIFIFLASIISYRLIEKPFLKIKSRFS